MIRIVADGLRDIFFHRNDMVRLNDGAGEQLEDVAAGQAIFVDECDGLFGRFGLTHLRQEFLGKAGDVVRQGVGGEDGRAGGEDAWTGDFAAVDAAAQGDGVLAVGTGIDDGREAGVRQHLRHLLR